VLSVFIGLGLDASLFGVFPVATICAGAAGPYSQGVCAVVAPLLAMSWALLSEGVAAISSVLPEIILGAALFYPAAKFGILPTDKALFSSPAKTQTTYGLRSVSDRMKNLSAALEKMSRVFSGLSSRLRHPDSSETASLCEEVFDESCGCCPKRHICHARESFDDGGVIRRVAAALSSDGKTNISAVPESMRKGCPEIDRIIGRINVKYRQLAERAFREDKTAAIAGDYADFAKMINECVIASGEECERNEALSEKLAEKLGESGITYESLGVYGKRRPQVYVRGFTVKDLTFGADDLRQLAESAVGAPLTDPEMSIDYDRLNMFCECRRRFSVSHGEYSAEGACGETNGDAVSSFKGYDGDFYMLICDGMGSGSGAALTSGAASLFLERMLGAGCSELSALEALNNFTKERKMECFSTVDLLKIDPYSGEATFFKSGAAPSFVLRRGKLFRIESATAPIGILDGVSAKSVKFDLSEGDHVIMLSDGVLPDEDDSGWFYDFIADKKNIPSVLPEAAKKIFRVSRDHCRRRDDSTVGIIRIDDIA